MLTNVIFSFRPRKGKVLKMISWKHSFKRLNEEYEIAKKKKQALDNLYENGRISQATRDSFDNDINAVITEIEKQQQNLLVKMHGKVAELESQIKTLETLLANYEIQHVVGEIEEEAYQREITLLSTGLESAKRELSVINEATNQLCPPPLEEPATEAEVEAEAVMPVEENVVEVVPPVQEELVENVPTAPEEEEVATEPCSDEPFITMEEAVPEQPEIECATSISAEMPEAPEVVEEAPQDVEYATEVTEEVTAEVTEEVIEEMPQVTDEVPETVEEDQCAEAEDMPLIMDETPENTENFPEITEEVPQEIEDQPQITEEMPEPLEESPEIAETSPLEPDEAPLITAEWPEEVHPSEAPKEAPPEISVEAIAEEGQETEEAAADAETADEETETQEL
jgi:hypothetical protein